MVRTWRNSLWLAAGIHVPILFFWSQAGFVNLCTVVWPKIAAGDRLTSAERHPEGEPDLLRRRSDLDLSAMGAGDFGGDVEPQSEALRRVQRGDPVERLEQAVD